jgi:hypothetical protein
MNANELADMAENACCAYQKEIATMLRQQQAEIEALKAKIDGLDMVIWKLQMTLTNRELRTYDGKLE